MTMMSFKVGLQKLWKIRSVLLFFLVPVLAAPLPILNPNSVAKCGYCVIVIGTFWVTEVIPLAVTSLLPVVLFPMFGVMTSKNVCRAYVQDTLMLFLGSLIVAVAVEKWNLHKRLALRTLTLVGPQTRWLLLGVMLPAWFLSMWMSNTATTAMMMPIVTAILLQVKECQLEESQELSMIGCNTQVPVAIDAAQSDISDGYRATNAAVKEESIAMNRADTEKKFLDFAKTFSLAVAFSSNVGGMATLTGTPPNVIFKGLADGLYLKYEAKNPVDFANWLAVGVPMSCVLLVFLWLWLQVYSQGFRCLKFWENDTTSFEKVRISLKEEYRKMGRMTFAEVMVLILFVLLAILWITRKPGFIPGWSDLFRSGYIGDSTPAIAISVLLFILPSKAPSSLWQGFKSSSVAITGATEENSTSYEPLLDWATVNKRMAWSVLLLMGGGFALAEACEASGLSSWVSGYLEDLSSLPNWVSALLLSILVTGITQVTSNAATTTLFVPIVGDLAIRMGLNPLYFMIPCTVASSLAFLLPVATPPNAIVFASGYLKVKDMVLAGLPVNIFAVIILNLALNSWVTALYGLDETPAQFRQESSNISIYNSSSMMPQLLSNVNETNYNTTALY